MDKRKKVFLIIAIVITAVLLITGISYAVLSYEKEGETQELIVGDIWMKYTETNQLVLEDAMPMNIDDYQVNEEMKTQEVNELNELTKCIEYLYDMPLIDGTMIDFCKGEGRAENNYTFQENLDNGDWFGEGNIINMLSMNIIEQDGDSYKVNTIMTTQEVQEINELTRCVNFYIDWGINFDSGSDAESFCRGTGTSKGKTIQEFFYSESNIGAIFLNEAINLGIIHLKRDNFPYFEFTISGKNTYTKKDILYEIVLNHGDSHENRTTRIRDDLLRFSLVEIKDGTEHIIIKNQIYENLVNEKIWGDVISKNTKEEINKTYRLYMWIDEYTIIGNKNQDYTMKEWEDIYASIKVNVNGGFVSANEVDESCFETKLSTEYIPNIYMTDEEINKCVTIFRDEWGWGKENYESWENYCDGTGTKYGYTFFDALHLGWFNSDELDYLEENNIIFVEESITITDYDEECGSDIIIPQTINGYNVRFIEGFSNKGLYSVVLPNTVVYIEDGAFRNNNILYVEIPSSVRMLFCGSFDEKVNVKKSDYLVCVSPV